MKSYFLKPAVAAVLMFFVTVSAKAQLLETFEAQVPYVNYFTSTGQPFTLTSAFAIYSSRNGIGYEQSHRFIDNVNNPVLNQVNSIKTTDGAIFSVKSLWLFTSNDGGNNPHTNGSLIIKGKVAGSTVYTIIKATGLNGSFGINNGFAFLDLVTEGGVDNSKVPIDEIEFQLQGNFNYLAIDNVTWYSSALLPTTITDFSASWKDGKVSLDWQTSFESNSSHFVIERGGDGVHFTPISKLKAAGFSSMKTKYNSIDESPLNGENYYRLMGYDLDGKSKVLGIKRVKAGVSASSACLYPNPVVGNEVMLKSNFVNAVVLYIISDMSGKIVKNGIVSSNRQSINISTLSKGAYVMKLSDGQVIRWVKN